MPEHPLPNPPPLVHLLVPPVVVAAVVVTPIFIAPVIIASIIIPTRPAIIVPASAISTLAVAFAVPRVIGARVVRAFVCFNRQWLAQAPSGWA